MLRVDLQLDIDKSRSSRLQRRTRSVVEIFQDPAVIAVLLLAVGAFGFGVYLDQQADQQYENLQQQVRAALRDSTSLQSDLRQAERLKERRGEIREKIQRIKQIDRGRYSYVHVMDQISAALPAETWIESLETQNQNLQTGQVTFHVTGFAATNDIVSQFINRLESSAFIRNVSFQSSQQVPMGIQEITEFTIRGRSAQPDLSFLETVRIMPDGTRVQTSGGPPGRAPGAGRGGGLGVAQQTPGGQGQQASPSSLRMRMDTATQEDTTELSDQQDRTGPQQSSSDSAGPDTTQSAEGQPTPSSQQN